jgi:hypothetical protein
MPSLASLSLGFRERFLSHDEITEQLDRWVAAFPLLLKYDAIGRTPEGRPIWMITLGKEPERKRPAVWVDANMHAGELSGSCVALSIAEALLALHNGEEHVAFAGLPSHLRERLADSLFYIVPRISPDGAEAVLRDGRYVRSVPRDARALSAAHWINEDMDGDGRALFMRKEDPTGDFVAHPSAPHVLVARTIEDAGPFYKVWPEGRIHNFDGTHVPAPSYLADNHPDLNRNFPFRWAAEPDQNGAGAFAGSEPEARAVIEAAVARPHLYAWLNLHTFGGCFIRPPGDVPDHKMDPLDLAIYKQVGEWAESITGYPMVSGFEEFLYEPDKPLFGALSEWAYEHRATLSYVCELWDLFARLGVPRPKRFVDYYTSLRREDIVKLATWDRDVNKSRIFVGWTKVNHPQLGEVEVGGIDRRVGLYNPPFELLGEVCDKQATLMLRVATLLPQLVVSHRSSASRGGTRVTLTVENRGYLGTYGVRGAQRRTFNEGLYAEVRAQGCEVEDARASYELGHLEGWGKGLQASSQAIFFQTSGGSDGSKSLSLHVAGKGTLEVRVGSPRTGFVTHHVEVG